MSARPALLDEGSVQALLAELPAWSLRDGKLYRSFGFADFVGAFSFMSAAALHAEKLDHHPEWYNVYNRVEVWLTTHDAGGITELDRELALRMDALAADATEPAV